MAAGLSIAPENFTRFQLAFEEELALQQHDSVQVIFSDGSLENEDFSLQTAHLIEQAGPWGQQFPEPLFDNVFRIIEQRVVGKNHLKMVLQLVDSSICLDAIAFNVDLDVWPNYRAQFVHALYSLDINDYQGRQKIQLIINKMKAKVEDLVD